VLALSRIEGSWARIDARQAGRLGSTRLNHSTKIRADLATSSSPSPHRKHDPSSFEVLSARLRLAAHDASGSNVSLRHMSCAYNGFVFGKGILPGVDIMHVSGRAIAGGRRLPHLNWRTQEQLIR
jgi:hypothetical protein